MAYRYDTADRIQVASIISDEIQAELSDTKGRSAIDYGCGTGLIGFALADRFRSILFVDRSLEMLRQVQRKIDAADRSNASTLCADFSADIPTGLRADYILLSQVLLHTKNHFLLLDRLTDILLPGGHLIIVDFDKNEQISSDRIHNGFSQTELTSHLYSQGFSAISSHTFYNGEALLMNKPASLFLLHANKHPEEKCI